MINQCIHSVIFFPLLNEPKLSIIFDLMSGRIGKRDFKRLKSVYKSTRKYYNSQKLKHLLAIRDAHYEYIRKVLPDTEPYVIREMHLLDAHKQIGQLNELIALKGITKKLPPHKGLVKDKEFISRVQETIRL